ncbi:FecR family protein [Pseudoflavitalea sp. G-6-1-2]|uniref:FecR family protein n=1 Tax=Pseudoflavitalea sp. G-6-1-2 TaxID=2728841 RepID=UPI00146B009F|nr:FecR family protein [Pseudoflavitalea sp. G-6-1-2]NML22431.1 FecR family protein [Pseudoflavitalea sp. G-6-1-2]
MGSPDVFARLLDKYLTQTITAEEQQQLFALIQSKKHTSELEAVVAEALEDDAFDVADDPVLRDLIFERILQQRETPVRRIPLYRRWAWAAAVLLLLGGATYFYFFTDKHQQSGIAEHKDDHNNIQPGSNKALLTLSDGTVIVLDSAANGAIAQQGNASVTKLPNGEVRYEVNGKATSKVMLNTMTTPNGGQYNLVLPDGSKIWLNAASSITYPAAFTGNQRQIKISGEVYMEIAKDKSRPFMVDVDGRSVVQVLGTSFNINSYTNEGKIKTTLIEGSVRVSNHANNNRTQAAGVMLRPGQQAVITASAEDISIRTANTDHVLAWKNGFINFESVSFQEIIRQIERWYDIDVQVEGPMPAVKIGGRMDRGVQLSDLTLFLNNFEIRTKLEGRKLILSQK